MSFARRIFKPDFDAVTVSDTVNLVWLANDRGFAIEEWLLYESPEKSPDEAQRIFIFPYVYIIADAEGDNFAAFRVDSVLGAGNLGNTGEVYISYIRQTTSGSSQLDPDSTQAAMISVGTGFGYFDFSAGQQVYPGDSQTSLDWDICFHDQAVRMNSSLHGPGDAQMYPAYLGSSDSTDFSLFTQVDTTRRFYRDMYRNEFIYGTELSYNKNWYQFDEPLGQFTSRQYVYLVKVGDRYFKMQITGYTNPNGNNQFGGNLSFRWLEL